MTQQDPIVPGTIATVKYQPEDELPRCVTDESDAEYDTLFGAMHSASQIGYDGQGGCRVYPYVEILGRRYYLVALETP